MILENCNRIAITKTSPGCTTTSLQFGYIVSHPNRTIYEVETWLASLPEGGYSLTRVNLTHLLMLWYQQGCPLLVNNYKNTMEYSVCCTMGWSAPTLEWDLMQCFASVSDFYPCSPWWSYSYITYGRLQFPFLVMSIWNSHIPSIPFLQFSAKILEWLLPLSNRIHNNLSGPIPLPIMSHTCHSFIYYVTHIWLIHKWVRIKLSNGLLSNVLAL